MKPIQIALSRMALLGSSFASSRTFCLFGTGHSVSLTSDCCLGRFQALAMPRPSVEKPLTLP